MGREEIMPKEYIITDPQGKQYSVTWDPEEAPTATDRELIQKAIAEGKVPPIEKEETSIKQPSQPNQEQSSTVKEIISKGLHQILPATGMAIGGTGGVILGSPTGPGAAISGLAGGGLGYAGGESIADLVDEYVLGLEKKDSSLKGSLSKTGKDILTGTVAQATGEITGPILSKIGELGGKAIRPVLGRLTGAGTGSIEEAISSGKSVGMGLNPLKSKTDFDKALRGQITGEDIVNNAKNALQTLKDQRATAYQESLAKITGGAEALAIPGQIPPSTQNIDLEPIAKKLVDLMKQYNVKVSPDGKILDTSRIAMGKSGRKDIEDIIQTVYQWGSQKGDNTATGLDALKRQLDDFYSDSSQARQFVTSLRNGIKDVIVKNVPEYEKMTKGYAEATKLIKDIESGLMLRKQGMTGRVVADQTLRRLMSAMRDNFALRKDLLDTLGAKGGEDLSEQVAGYSMRSVVPLGLAGTGPAMIGEAALAHLVSPAFWPVIAASSPRVSAEFLRFFGKAIGENHVASILAGKGIGYFGAKALTKTKGNQ